MRFKSWPLSRRLAVIFMMAAAVALALQGTFIGAWEAATGENSHYQHGDVHSHSIYKGLKGHIVAHVHPDGTIHRHAVSAEDGALVVHLQEPGCPCCWNMAIVVGVLPSLSVCTPVEVASSKLSIESPDPCCGTEPSGPRRPPRPLSIA